MKKLITLTLALLALVCCFALSSCGSEEVTTLYVYNWGEYISDGSEDSLDTNKAFEEYYYEKTGKRVVVNYFGSIASPANQDQLQLTTP